MASDFILDVAEELLDFVTGKNFEVILTIGAGDIGELVPSIKQALS